MKKTRFFSLYKDLSLSEQRRFGDFVDSPFFNKNRKLRQLWRFIDHYAPDFDDENFNKENAYAHSYRESRFDRFRFNNLLSDLFQLLQEFLAQIQEPPGTPALAQALLHRNAPRQTERTLRHWAQTLQDNPRRDHHYFYETYLHHEVADQLFLQQVDRQADAHLQEKSDALDKAFWLNKLRIACEMTSRNELLQANYRCDGLETLDAWLQAQAQLAALPALQVYQTVLALLQHSDNPSAYFQLKKQLQSYPTLFPKSELQNLYGYALNYCIRQINFGQSDFYTEILDLYKALLQQEILLEEGYLSMWTFRNIVTAGIRTASFEWTDQFIEQYQQYLNPENRANAVQYNRAAFYYAQKDYQAALQQLHGVEFTDNYYQIGVKTIQLKSYFELEETEALLALSEAFRKYLNRHKKLSDYHRSSNLHFIGLALNIYKLRQQLAYSTTKNLERQWVKCQQQLTHTRPLSNKDWLELQLNALASEFSNPSEGNY